MYFNVLYNLLIGRPIFQVVFTDYSSQILLQQRVGDFSGVLGEMCLSRGGEKTLKQAILPFPAGPETISLDHANLSKTIMLIN